MISAWAEMVRFWGWRGGQKSSNSVPSLWNEKLTGQRGAITCPRSPKWFAAASSLGCSSFPPSVVNPLGQALWQTTREAYWKAVKNVRQSADVILKVIYLFYCRSWLPLHPSSCSRARFCPLMFFVAFSLPLAWIRSRAWPKATGAFICPQRTSPPPRRLWKIGFLELLSTQDVFCCVCVIESWSWRRPLRSLIQPPTQFRHVFQKFPGIWSHSLMTGRYLGDQRISWFLFVGKEAEIQRGEVIHPHAGRGARIVILASDPESVALSIVSCSPWLNASNNCSVSHLCINLLIIINVLSPYFAQY